MGAQLVLNQLLTSALQHEYSRANSSDRLAWYKDQGQDPHNQDPEERAERLRGKRLVSASEIDPMIWKVT